MIDRHLLYVLIRF